MTEQDALEWVAELFEESIDDISASTLREQIPGWDSLGILTLLAAFDRNFDLELSDKEVMAMESVGDILDTLKKNGKVAE